MALTKFSVGQLITDDSSIDTTAEPTNRVESAPEHRATACHCGTMCRCAPSHAPTDDSDPTST